MASKVTTDYGGMTDRQILEAMMKKMECIDGIQATLNSFTGRLSSIETNVSGMQAQVDDLERGVSHIETEFEDLRDRIKQVEDNSVSKRELYEANRQIVDLSNHARRNNLIMYNVPEGTEGEGRDGDCRSYVKNFISTTLGMDPIPEVQAAHRSSRNPNRFDQTDDLTQSENAKEDRWRPIHILFTYRPDKEAVLEQAIAAFKSKKTDIYFTDDVHPHTRNIQKKLVPIMKDMRKKGWLAFIPWKVPRVIKYKSTPKGTPGRLKTYRLEEDFTSFQGLVRK